MTNDQRKSDTLVVPAKSPNIAEQAAEVTEGRRVAKGNIPDAVPGERAECVGPRT